MAIEIKVPDIGADEVEITEILVKVGDKVEAEQSLITVVMGYSSPALTCVKASRRKSWRVSIRPVGQRRAYILTTAASGKLRLKKRLLSWPRSQKWWRLVNVASTLTATFRRRKSRNALLLPSYALPQN